MRRSLVTECGSGLRSKRILNARHLYGGSGLLNLAVDVVTAFRRIALLLNADRRRKKRQALSRG
jgi:hypothetical protein